MKRMHPDSDYMKRTMEQRNRSHDPDRQVGAIIVGREGDVISAGANAPPHNLRLSPSESLKAIAGDPTWKYFVLEHAERNAINAAYANGFDLRDTTMYCTLFPCADCARAIVAAGISRLVLPRGIFQTDRDEKWHTHYHYAREIFELAAIKLDFI